MSIGDWIKTLELDGRAYLLNPVLPGDPVERVMVLSEEVWKLLAGPWPNSAWARRCGRLRADLETFVTGGEISLSMTPYQAGSAYMGILNPVERGVWDVRSRDPQPGIRILGQFVERDVFAALTPASRSVSVPFLPRGPLDHGQSASWKAVIRECEAEFRKLFHPFPAVCGGDPDAYVSRNFHVV